MWYCALTAFDPTFHAGMVWWPWSAAVTSYPAGHPCRCPALYQGWRSNNSIPSPDVDILGQGRD